jgi:type I restriction enzyme M protein
MGKPEAKGKAALFQIFKQVEGCFWEANIEPGLPRFLEVANLLFLKLLEERQQGALWETLKSERNKAQCLNEVIIPKLQGQDNAQDVFSPTRITNESSVKKMVAILDKGQLASFDSDILGEAYQYFLKDNLTSKQNLGQYFTPRAIARIMASLASPASGDTIYDPFCGTGGLLVEAFSHIKEFDSLKAKTLFFGKDVSISTRVAKMNAILHWGDPSGIEQVFNTLEHPVHGKYAIGLTNVPFCP